MQALKLQAKTWESRSRAQQSSAPPLAEENPKRQVRFNLDEELGGEPILPTSMTLFCLGKKLLSNILTLHCGLTMKKAPNKGTRPKVWSSAIWSLLRPERPDPVSHPHRWIQADMLKIPYIPWWKTLMSSGERTMFSGILHESLSKPEALCLACWQAVAFWLPWSNRKQQDSGPLHLQSLVFTSKTTCLPLLPLTSK